MFWFLYSFVLLASHLNKLLVFLDVVFVEVAQYLEKCMSKFQSSK